ncbi:radical SAM protein [Pseudoflavonifractor sp. 60]|uniref:coproporphyrinogen-III oxidase family protein n=1 Tax=Pseudoflavonifractor sp. 60 TaxID=2304576 RepID=UPI0013711F96|nr:radical SAM protein [Pseudoflavonifractor sp. 60]NBI65733.1 radical SAM protein [Pseudoflavonifractor sp. 60]
MSIITNCTRMWLTRSVKPFLFQREYDEALPYGDCRDLGLYVHIPFCRTLCGFCPYCKEVYDRERCDRYLDALIREIHQVGGPERKRVTSLYFGGGTPALAAERLGEVIAALEDHFIITQGIGVELSPDDVTVPVLRTLREAGVTKVSIGVQSFQEKYQTMLGRRGADRRAMAEALARVPFETVSMDFIFALPGQTFQDLRVDLETAFLTGANHVAIYPFIDFSFTAGGISPMGRGEKRTLLDRITRWCLEQGYVRTSIWTFASQAGAGYSSMTRDNFLGFGCSAATLLGDQFKINTFSVEEYCGRMDRGTLPTALTLRFTPRQRMVYYLFWTAYSTRVDAAAFEEFFGVSLKKMYGLELALAKGLGLVTERSGVYEMTLKGAFYYHYYENFYTLAYIDKMWGLLRREAFPEKMVL